MPTEATMTRLTKLYERALDLRADIFQRTGDIECDPYTLADLISDTIIEVKQIQLEVTNIAQQLHDIRNGSGS